MAVLSVYLSAETLDVLTKDVELYSKKFAEEYKVELALVKAIIRQESNNDTNAMRYEKHLRKQIWYTKLLTADEKTNTYSYFSMGCMQVLFGIAKSEGFKGKPYELLEPKLSIAYGVLHLKTLIHRYYYLDQVISAYNQGTPKKDDKGKFCNQYYVDRVLKYYKEYGGKE